MTLLDTSVASNYLHPQANQRFPELVAFVDETVRASGLFISVVTQYELRRGVGALLLRGQGRRKSVAIERFLDTAYVLGLDDRAGEGWNLAASLWAQAHVLKPSLVLGEADLLIAATAAFHGRPLATTDGKLGEALGKLAFPVPVQLLRLA
jgi:predicted nucleic acid-binding protein